MTFSPVIHPLLLVVIGAAALTLCGVALARTRSGRERLLWGARVGFVLACVIMLARPGIPGGQSETYATDADVFIVLDTTASIVAEDWADGEPRLVGARADVEAIAEQYPGARFSLITFDSTTEVRLPLTTDTAALESAMSVLSPEVTSRSAGSSISQAQSVLRDVLRGAADSGQDRSRIVFYLGDGEQTAASEPGSFADSAQFVDEGRVLGYGTAAGGPMRETTASPSVSTDPFAGDAPPSDDGYIEYQGAPALSVIDEENLEQIAAELGVDYELRSADEPVDLPEAPPVTVQQSAGQVGNVIELYWIPAIIAGLWLAFEVARIVAAVVRLRDSSGDRDTRQADGAAAGSATAERGRA